MKKQFRSSVVAAAMLTLGVISSQAGQAPLPSDSPDTPISNRDRVFAAEQFSNTVSVTDPSTGKLLGLIRLGDPTPGNVTPLYRGQLLVHGLGFSPDRTTLAVVSIGSNSVTFIDTATNAVRKTTYLGRSPHEAFYTPDGKELWVTVRGEDYVSVIDAATMNEKTRIQTPIGPGMQIFSPDGKYGYICSSFTPETIVVDVASHVKVGSVKQDSPFCPNIAATPDGEQVWMTLKDVGKVMVFQAKPPFAVLKTMDTGPLTNHVNFVRDGKGQRAYVTIGGLNVVKVFNTGDFMHVATIPTGKLPHGIWPSGDGSRVYVGLENDDQLAVIDTSSNRVVGGIDIGQAPQALVYVPAAVASGDGKSGLEELGESGSVATVELVTRGSAKADKAPTSVSFFDQGLIQILQASATGLEPRKKYVLALSQKPDGSGKLQGLSEFMTNPAGSAVVNAVGPLRQLVRANENAAAPRFLVIAPQEGGTTGSPVQVQVQVQ